jgi:putative ABC transport system permease protein
MLRRMRAFLLRLLDPIVRRARERELEAELQAHLQLHIDDNVRAGFSPDEARRAALLKLGGVEAVKERYRDRRGLPLLDTLLLDVRYGARLLLRTPTVTAVVILSLALGIGANTAMFSILDALLLRALPVRDPQQLVIILKDGEQSELQYPFWEQLRDIRAQRNTFAGAGAWATTRLAATDTADATRAVQTHPVEGLYVTGTLFDLLGVPAVLGRTLVDADDRRGGGADGPVAVISYRYWRDHFGGAPDVVGRRITLNRVPFTIVGVTPETFFGPNVGEAFDIAFPFGIEPLMLGKESRLDRRSSWWMTIALRLHPNQTVEEATTALRAIQPEIRTAILPKDFRPEDVKRFLSAPWNLRPAANGASELRTRYRSALITLMVVVGLVLLIACVNIAHLLLARANARRQEFSVRLALGASRMRICRQLLIESLLLSVAGTTLGVLFARWGAAELVHVLSTRTREVVLDLSIDPGVLAFTMLAAVGTAMLFGIAPAIQAARCEPTEGLRAQGAGSGTGAGRTIAGENRMGLGSLLVIAQVALSLVLIVAAGLFVASFARLSRQALGFDSHGVLVAHVEARPDDIPTDQRARFSERMQAAAAAVPGVALATASSVTPVSGSSWGFSLDAAHHEIFRRTQRSVYANIVGPDFFKTYGTRLIAGREFTAADTSKSTPVVIVNETFVRQVFQGASPIGRIVYKENHPGQTFPPREVIGYVADTVCRNLRQTPPPMMYMPLSQHPMPESSLEISVRPVTGMSPESLIAPLRVALGRGNSGYDVSMSFIPLAEQIGNSLIQERLLAGLSAFFGGLGLLLAAIGLYGVTAYNVTRRRTEIGIRMALGAVPGRMIGMVLIRVTLLVTIGIIAGTAFALWAARLVTSLLFGLEPGDPRTLIGAGLLLAAVALLAAWLPARRAALIDPATVLREG